MNSSCETMATWLFIPNENMTIMTMPKKGTNCMVHRKSKGTNRAHISKPENEKKKGNSGRSVQSIYLQKKL
jgi:hypothetical protein